MTSAKSLLFGVLAGMVAFVLAFACLFLFGPPTWAIFFPIAFGLLVGRWAAVGWPGSLWFKRNERRIAAAIVAELAVGAVSAIAFGYSIYAAPFTGLSPVGLVAALGAFMLTPQASDPRESKGSPPATGEGPRGAELSSADARLPIMEPGGSESSRGASRKGPFLLGLLAFVCLLAGAGVSAAVILWSPWQGGGDDPVIEATPREPAPGYVRFVSQSKGYSIDVPEGWEQRPDYELEYEGTTFTNDYFLGSVEGDFQTNVNIGEAPVGLFSADQVYAREAEGARSLHDDLVESDVDVAGAAGKLFHYQGQLTGQPPFDLSQIIVVVGATEWILTLSTALGDRDRHLPTFMQMVESFVPE